MQIYKQIQLQSGGISDNRVRYGGQDANIIPSKGDKPGGNVAGRELSCGIEQTQNKNSLIKKQKRPTFTGGTFPFLIKTIKL
ncbi:hypothetical protein Barb6_03034 [Bacteroidales bacterium Barb6]|nr:hypothetical protein Barb6_03034 [Bacteroidales bacterium Barb6]